MSLDPDAVDCSLCSNKEIVQKKSPIFYHSYSLNVLIVRPENRKIELKDKVVFLAMLNCSTLESVEIVVSTCQSYILNCMRSQQWPY